jgi:uncharacterized alkaline shock family protein YloU
MNTAALDGSDAPVAPEEPAAGQPPGLVDRRDETGRVEIADRVVEKIAGHAVILVPHAGAAPRRLLGMSVGEAGAQEAASVSADVQDGIASIRATIAVRWPNSVRAVADEVRRRIRDEVTSQTGVEVDHVDVEVVSMTFAEPAEPRVR